MKSHELILPWQWYDVWGQVSACASHYWVTQLFLSHHTCSRSWSLLWADGALKPHRLGHKPQPDCTVEAWKTWNMKASLYVWHTYTLMRTTLKARRKKICYCWLWWSSSVSTEWGLGEHEEPDSILSAKVHWTALLSHVNRSLKKNDLLSIFSWLQAKLVPAVAWCTVY